MSMLETLPLMMLGMALFRNGFLTGGWAFADYRRTGRRWLPPGVVLALLVGWLQWRSGFDYLVAVNAFMAWAGPGRLMMTIAYARSEEHTSELQSLMRNSYAVFCLQKKKVEHTSEATVHIAIFEHVYSL